ncbi:kinesin-domain-containing protein [Piromyces finnis]|uniref:Kinesin-domain-containing protein n=1 Tax=Piromyces finnis TaxID=1754191 RepID=A0A1Y1VGR5_9FUNG|nr:kinesin-domain-containing protein [Piromyces finnis]|eukprot:ORX54901.1 kinesin-domain-containing protein [Piromyces finnis]
MSLNKNNTNETNIKVVVRIRPPTEKEILNGYPISITPKGSNQVVAITSHATTTRTFSFDKVFSQYDNQATIYSTIISPMIKEVLEGYNCTIFAYGQTGTGKTYTMEGDLTKITKDDIIIGKDCGMIPRALDEFFSYLNKDGIEYSLRVSCIEIYNEQLKDLLTSDTSLKLQFYENAYKKITVKNLEEIPVKNVYDAIQLFQKGMNERKTASTNYNERSSRSHCVYSITVHITESSHGQDLIKVGKLNLVDLAGSESIGRSGAENKQAREAGMINQSLLALGRVINSLVENTQHIPYRESKLTRLLQDSLGGKTKTCIIATVAPTRYSIEESLSTLDYAFRAKNIRNKPEVNQHMTKKALIQDYMNEIKHLKNMLRSAREKDGVYLSNEDYNQLKFSYSANDEENKRLKKLIDDQEQEIIQLKQSVKSRSDEIQELKNQINEKLHIIIQKEKDISNISQQLVEESVLLKSHMLSEDNLNNILNDLNEILRNCSLDLYKHHLFTDNKLSLERENRMIFIDFRNRTMQLMKDLIVRIDTIKSQNNYYDNFLFQSIQTFISKKIKDLNEIYFNINNRMNKYEEKIKNLNLLSNEYISYNDNSYQLMKEKKIEFMNSNSALFSSCIKNINNELESYNSTFNDKSNMLNQANEKINEEINILRQGVSSFINMITNKIVSIKDDIIRQKNKEINDLKNDIAFIKKEKLNEIKSINEDKKKLLNKITGLIEEFSDSHQKMFNKTVEPLAEKLTTMSNDLGNELEQFNKQFTEVETNINAKDSLLNNSITSLDSNIKTYHQDNINFIYKSKDNYNKFNITLKNDINQMDCKISDFNKLNGDLLRELELRSNDYKTNIGNYNSTISTEFENNRTFINNNYNNNIKSYRDYLENTIYNNNENEELKTNNYNDCQLLSDQLNNELNNSNVIFKENPLLNKAPEKNKYYNIYSWKTTPDHDIILNKYRKLYNENETDIKKVFNNDNEVVNINIIKKNEDIDENTNDESDCANENINIENENKSNKINKKNEDTSDLFINDISIKKVLYLSHNNINYNYKEMKIEELNNENSLFNNNVYEICSQDIVNYNKDVINKSATEENNILNNDKQNTDISCENYNGIFIANNEEVLFETREEFELNTKKNDIEMAQIVINKDVNDESISDSESSSISFSDTVNQENKLKSNTKNINATKSIQKMDSAIELNEKINNESLKLNTNASSDLLETTQNVEEVEDKLNNNIIHDSLVTRKTFKNQKPLIGFNFTENKKILFRSSSVPNTPTTIYSLQKLPSSKDDSFLKIMHEK